MACSKTKKIFFIFLIIVVVLLPFALITKVCASDIDPVVFDGYITNGSTGDVSVITKYNGSPSQLPYPRGAYIPVKAGFTYKVTGNFSEGITYRAFVSDVTPSEGVEGLILYSGQLSNDYYFTATQDGYLLFWNWNISIVDNFTFSTAGGMTDSVDSLTENVGLNSIWNIFDISINYIVVVVVAVFGLFIIFSLIRKLTKGKEGF